MKQTFCRYVRSMRFFWRVEEAEVERPSIGLQARAPFPLVSADAKKADFVIGTWFALIFTVYSLVNVANIAEPIVAPEAVDVIDCFRPLACDIEPSQAMGQVLLRGSCDPEVTGVVAEANREICAITRPMLLCGSSQSEKESCLGIIVKNLAQSLRGKIDSSHEALLKLIGRGSAGVPRTSPTFAL